MKMDHDDDTRSRHNFRALHGVVVLLLCGMRSSDNVRALRGVAAVPLCDIDCAGNTETVHVLHCAGHLEVRGLQCIECVVEAVEAVRDGDVLCRLEDIEGAMVECTDVLGVEQEHRLGNEDRNCAHSNVLRSVRFDGNGEAIGGNANDTNGTSTEMEGVLIAGCSDDVETATWCPHKCGTRKEKTLESVLVL